MRALGDEVWLKLLDWSMNSTADGSMTISQAHAKRKNG